MNRHRTGDFIVSRNALRAVKENAMNPETMDSSPAEPLAPSVLSKDQMRQISDPVAHIQVWDEVLEFYDLQSGE